MKFWPRLFETITRRAIINNSFFISDEEKHSFQESHCPRRIASNTSEYQDIDYITNKISYHIKNTLKGRNGLDFRQEAILIKANKDDGITWACEESASYIHEKHRTWKTVTFAGNSFGALPEVVKYTGRKQFIKCLNSSEFLQVKNSKIIPLVSKLLLFSIIVVLNIIIHFLYNQNNGYNPFLFIINRLNLSPLTIHIIISVVTAAMFLTIDILKNIKTNKGKNIYDEGIVEELNSHKNRSKNYKSLLDKVAYRLLDSLTYKGPAFVIIDDFSRLDQFSQDVILKATNFNSQNSPNSGTCIWFIFENLEALNLINKVNVDNLFAKKFCNNLCSVYRLSNLNDQERSEICRNLDISNNDNILIKNLISGASKEKVENFKLIWKEFIQLNYKQDNIDPVSIAKIIVMNGCPPYNISQEKYISIFSEKSESLFYLTILSFFKNNKSLQRHEVKDILSIIISNLKPFFIQFDNPKQPLVIDKTVDDVVKDSVGINKSAINLFWLIYWLRQSDFDSYQVIQKIAYHASEASFDIKLIETENGKEICKETLNKLIKLIEVCIHKILFTQARDIGIFLLNNIEKILKAFSSDEQLNKALNKLTNIFWQSYILTNDENLLKMFLEFLSNYYKDNLNLSQSYSKKLEDREHFVYLLNLYFQIIGSPKSIDQITLFERVTSKDIIFRKRLLDFIALNVADCLYFLPESIDFDYCQLPSFNELSNLIYKTFDRNIYYIPESDEEINSSILNFQNQKNFIRNLLRNKRKEEARDLIISFVLKESDNLSQSVYKDKKSSRELTLLEKALQIECFAECLNFMIASIGYDNKPDYPNISPPKIKLGENADPNLAKLIKERIKFPDNEYFFLNNRYPQNCWKDLKDLVEFIFPILGLEMKDMSYNWKPNEPISTKIFENIENMYIQAAIAWEELGIKDLRNRAFIERAQFVINFSNIDREKPNTYRNVFGSLSEAIYYSAQSSQNISITSGIISHLLIFRFLSRIQDIASFYFSNLTSQIIIELDYSNNIKYIFSIISLNMSHRSSPQNTKIANYLVNRFIIKDELLKIIKEREERGELEVSSTFHNILDIAKISRDDELFEKTIEICNYSIDDNYPDLSKELNLYIKFHKFFKENENNKRLSDDKAKALIEKWKFYQDHWLYPSVLNIIFSKLENEPKEDFITYLIEYMENSIFETSPLMELLVKTSESIVKGKVKKFNDNCRNLILNKALNDNNFCKFNLQYGVDLYCLLSKLDVDNKNKYLNESGKLNEIILERDKANSLSSMISKGHFWNIFIKYFSCLEMYGLPISIEDGKFCKPLEQENLSSNELINIINRSDIDNYLRLIKNFNILYDFILLGKQVFNYQVDNLKNIEEFRQRINLAVKKELKEFFRIIANSSNVPQGLRDLINQHIKEIPY